MHKYLNILIKIYLKGKSRANGEFYSNLLESYFQRRTGSMLSICFKNTKNWQITLVGLIYWKKWRGPSKVVSCILLVSSSFRVILDFSIINKINKYFTGFCETFQRIRLFVQLNIESLGSHLQVGFLLQKSKPKQQKKNLILRPPKDHHCATFDF